MLLLLLNNRVSKQNENRGLGLGFFVYNFEFKSYFLQINSVLYLL